MADSNSSSNPASAAQGNNAADSRPTNSGRGQTGSSRGGRGGRGGRQRGQNGGRRGGFGSKGNGGKRKGDMGRSEYNRENIDKRKRNDDSRAAKRQKTDETGEVSASPFTKEEIESESRKPKRKVAVMVGYAGSGYKGMQINSQEKTIEGDLFNAFVKAGAISKANADDPKKSSLVRCARTDKGVHAAGNVISLKLIVEDPDVVKNINEHLPSQIRVWGIERTNGAFSCYQTCDSRWYEYLIPTFAFIPPHPQSYLGKKLKESAENEGVTETYKALQADADSFWEAAEEAFVKPILDKLDPETAVSVMAGIHSAEEKPEPEIAPGSSQNKEPQSKDGNGEEVKTELAASNENQQVEGEPSRESKPDPDTATEKDQPEPSGLETEAKPADSKSVLTPFEATTKEVKAAYIKAKKTYRISQTRRDRVQEALHAYLGTKNFHNYTIQKTFSDPSAKRVIRSFNVGKDPVIINDTEWLSLKVHGQSFMMHQIRKMVAMAALVVRCGSPISIMQESYGPANISIPKAPGLGLLLERPVFDSYNEKAVSEYNKDKIDFNKYQKEMDEFKQREIYDRIFREEERDHQFHDFFNHVDHYRSDYFLWVTAAGISAAKQSKAKQEDVSEDEADPNGEEG